ncbi:Mitochondrial chaperone BCS1 [Strongyloides ratti]|uniref:Mitochondrial chaperone BCS1 n=1 Tax=Strongyloides ratti TaxID=34506 RepID=A0A090KY71_STRRB|nr:Mitochondrial chaperone BCS1 [Strongyloides ratti]CEF62376.1 Mitochondrial chaperone BCS1 [Strongyloides ratti]
MESFNSISPNKIDNVTTEKTISQDVKTVESPKFTDSLFKNQFFSAGLGLAGLGMLANIGRRSLILFNAYFRRRFMTSLTLNNEDLAYPWVLNYINKKSATKTRNLTVNSVVNQSESGKTSTEFYFLPGHGIHYFKHNRRWIQVDRQREKQVISNNNKRTPLETVTLTTIGTDVGFWRNFLAEATEEALSNVETGLVVYNAVGPDWRRFGPARRKRPLDSVILEDNLSKKIHDDLEEFIKSGSWYTDRGIPYRRGYLLYGPPGSGKSSYISALAGHFGYSISPSNSIILLEDIDAAFQSREDPMQNHRAYDGMTRVTFSGLLNAIDGVACAEERILFMTTNHLDRLDPALIRPGRVDMKEYFGYCTPKMVEQLFDRFYGPMASTENRTKFVEIVGKFSGSISPAQIQGLLLMFKNKPKEAIEYLVNTLENKNDLN